MKLWDYCLLLGLGAGLLFSSAGPAVQVCAAAEISEEPDGQNGEMQMENGQVSATLEEDGQTPTTLTEDGQMSAELEEDGQTSEISQGAENPLLTIASSFASDLLARDFEKLQTDYEYDAVMKTVAASGQLEQSFASLVSSSGAPMVPKEAFVSAVQGGYTNVDVPCLSTAQPQNSWNLTVTFDSQGAIAGIHINEYQEGLPTTPDDVTETELSLEIGEGRKLPGTLTMPRLEEGASCPVVILVHGSGASDRNETLGQIAPFQDLAWGLAQRGVASYRYDKINYVYGDELAADSDFTVYDETVDDAVAAIGLLREQPGVSGVFVLGHSQGGMMMGAIAEDGSPDGCILLAAPARGFSETFQRQILFLESLNENPTAEEQQLYDYYNEEIKKMENLDALPENDTVLGQSLTYIRSLLDYDALEKAKSITVPVLVLQGEEDYQVTMEDFSLWQETFQEQENWSFQSFPGLTHLFVEGIYEEGPNAYVGEKHVAEEVLDVIADFLLQSPAGK